MFRERDKSNASMTSDILWLPVGFRSTFSMYATGVYRCGRRVDWSTGVSPTCGALEVDKLIENRDVSGIVDSHAVDALARWIVRAGLHRDGVAGR